MSNVDRQALKNLRICAILYVELLLLWPLAAACTLWCILGTMLGFPGPSPIADLAKDLLPVVQAPREGMRAWASKKRLDQGHELN